MQHDPSPLGTPAADVPPRPDTGERLRAPLFAAFIFVTVLAVLFGVFAIGSLLGEPDALDLAGPPSSPPAAPTRSPTPTPTPVTEPRSRVDGTFRFLERAVTGDPVRWDPCRSITYAINARGADTPVKSDLKEALERITAATGIEFESVGTTRETFISAYQRMRYDGVIRKAELIIIWVDHDDYQEILRQLRDPRPSIAFAKTMQGLYVDRDQYFGGIIVMDDDATSFRGFTSTYSHGSVLLHELGHIMGLDHVKDPDQLMYSGRHPNWSLRGFGPGDLEGLRRLGDEAGCLD